MEQPFLFAADGPWIPIRDGNPTGMSLFMRHYTARERRKVFQFVGPGEKYVLLTADALVRRVLTALCSETKGPTQGGLRS
jgi:hypothetical protein